MTLDKPSPLFTGILRPLPEAPVVYIRYLPVTTEIARDQGDWIRCRLDEGSSHILTLAVRQHELKPAPSFPTHGITVRRGRLLRFEMITSEREESASRSAADVRLELGDHRIA